MLTQDERVQCCLLQDAINLITNTAFKGRRQVLRPKARILDDPLGNPNDDLKVLFGPLLPPQKLALGPIGWPKEDF